MAGNAYFDVSSVGRTSAVIAYSADGWPYPDDHGSTTTNTSSTGDSKNGSETTKTTTITYSDGVFRWTFSDGASATSKSGNHTFTGLTPGMERTVSGTLSVTVTKTTKVVTTTKTWTTTGGGEDAEGNPIPETTTTNTSTDTDESDTTVSLGSASTSTTVYTQPNIWSWGIPDGNAYIADYITAAKWNDLADQVGKYQSWKLQSNKYSDYNHLKVSAGDWISASIYNSMASACGSGTSATASQTLISKALFDALANAVS